MNKRNIIIESLLVMVLLLNNETFDNTYSDEQESRITEMINYGFSYKDIAENLGRTYYGIYDKIRRMKG